MFNAFNLSKHLPIHVTGWICLFLILSGCCSAHTAQMEIITVTPPSELMTPCDPPQARSITTNRDLVYYMSELQTAFEQCAAKVDAIRSYCHDRNH